MSTLDVQVLDDDTLLARAVAGDVAAFGELVRRHQTAALRVAAVVSGSTEEAKDIVQEAFVAAHRSLATYRGTGSVRSWLLRVVANRARNQARGRVRRLWRDTRHAALELRAEVGPDEQVERRAEHEAVARALAALRLDDREVLGCRFVIGMSESETAEVLGLAMGTVKSRTSRALVRLRAALDVDEEEVLP